MRKLVLLSLVMAVFIGCKTTTHNDFFIGMDYSTRNAASVNSVGLGFQGRPMFSDKVGLAYQVGFLIPTMFDYQANGFMFDKSNMENGFGISGFVAPSFELLNHKDKIGLFISPGINFNTLVLTHHTEIGSGYSSKILTDTLGMSTMGIGVDVSSDFYLGKYFMMRFGVTMGLDFFTTDTVDVGNINQSYNNGIAQFRIYPKLGIGWRKTKEQKISNRIDMHTPDVYTHTFSEDKPYYQISRLWLADMITDASESIEIEDGELKIIKGELSVGGVMNLKWIDYTIRVQGNTVSIVFSNYRQGTDKYNVFTHGEHKAFKKYTDMMAESLFNYIHNFE